MSAAAVPAFRVLQCGYSKSGNYLLHQVASAMLEAHGRFRSFVERGGVGAAIDALCPDTRRMPTARRVDNLKLVDGSWHVQFPDLRARFLPVDWELVLRSSTLVWSHDDPVALAPWEDDFSHRLYVLRDGRDVVNSMLHYLVTPAILRLYPDHRFETLEQIYADLDFFAGKVCAWRDHARAYLARADRYQLVRYETLVGQREAAIDAIGVGLGLAVDGPALAERTSFERMRRWAPRHVRRGQRGDWRRHFRPEHRDLFRELAGPELITLRYEDSDDW